MMLFALCVGGAVAWATTGVFSFAAFFIVAALGMVAYVGLSRLKPYLPGMFAPLLVIVVYWAQAGRLDWPAIWPTIVVAAMGVQRWPVAARFGNRGYVIAYGILLVGVAAGGMPAWCLLCLLTVPLARRVMVSTDKALDVEWMAATGMFLVAGYLIKGLVR